MESSEKLELIFIATKLTGNTFVTLLTSVFIYHQLQHFAVKEVNDSFLTVFVQFQHLLHGLLCLTVPLQHTKTRTK